MGLRAAVVKNALRNSSPVRGARVGTPVRTRGDKTVSTEDLRSGGLRRNRSFFDACCILERSDFL